MSKYVPSINKNNSLKEEFIKQYSALLYKAEKGRVHSHLDLDELNPILDSLKLNLSKFEGVLGTGKENIYDLYETAKALLVNLEKKLNQELISQVEESADELIYAVESWEDVLNGKVEFDLNEFKKEKSNWSKKRLLNRLEELEQIKVQFADNDKRLEKDIILLEKDSAELDSIMLKEDNERRLNEVYRKITTLKSKIDSLNIRRSNYSACYNLLDLIYVNAKEIITASDYSSVDLGKAKAFLNLGKLKQVLNEPEKAISILRRMEKDVTEIAEKTKVIDSKILNIDTNGTSVSSDALAYKEELMKKQKDKKTLEDLEQSEKKVTKFNEIKGDK